MLKTINKRNKNAKMALSQIFLLLVSIVAISYALGSEVGIVSGKVFDGDCVGFCKISNTQIYDEYTGNIYKKNTGAGPSWTIIKGPDAGSTIRDANTIGLLDKELSTATVLFQLPSNAGEKPSGAQAPASGSGNNQQVYDDSACIAKGGICGSICTGGTTTPGLCGGPSNRICCIPRTGDEDPKAQGADTGGDGNNNDPPPVAGISALVLNRFSGKSVDLWSTSEPGKNLVGTLTPVKGEDGVFKLIGEDGNAVQVNGKTEFTRADVSEMNAAGIWGGMGVGFLGNLAEGAAWALGLATAINFFAPILGFDPSETQAITNAFAIGALATGGIRGAVEQWGTEAGIKAVNAQYLGLSAATWVGVGVGALYFVDNYKKESKKTAVFTCYPWQAPLGGQNCEACNEGDLPCSEYQCKSLGQACELINKGTDEEKCAWVNRNDVNPPVIAPLEEVLPENYNYQRQNTGILPPDRGVIVENLGSSDKCIPAFTPFRFGITTINNGEGEPAKCKVDKVRKPTFDEMAFFMSDGLFRYNHTFSLSLPGTANLEAEGVEVENGGNYELFVKCQDANGNENVANFVFKYCVDDGPDTTPPLIDSTSISNGLPVQYDTTSLDLDVYINEPVQACKWSHTDTSYESMENSMDCSLASSISRANAFGLYTCRTTLNGLKDRFENEFFFKCKDITGNENKESYEYKVIGTQPLVIDSVTPNNETIRDSTDAVKVTFDVRTSAGYKEGESTCYYSGSSDTGEPEDADGYIAFFETNSFRHKQDLFLVGGTTENPVEYTYYIRCVDLGGNADYEKIIFDVASDNEAPEVVRASHEENYLKITTNEASRCVYDTLSCSYVFEDGIKITTTDDSSHFVDWNPSSNYYIKCKDEFDNQPNPDECNILVRPSDF